MGNVATFILAYLIEIINVATLKCGSKIIYINFVLYNCVNR